MKKLAMMLVCVMTVGVLGGCGSSFDAAAYTKALLDNSYKNDSTQFVSTKVGTAEQAAELYEQGIDAQLDALLVGMDVTEEQENEYRDVVGDILAAAKYTVGAAEKQDDGSFIVTVSCEKMHIFNAALEDFEAQYEAKYAELMESETGMSEDEITDWYLETLKNSLTTALANATYDAPVDTTIHIELSDRVYSPNANDLVTLSNALFDNE
ncbi:MAG: hypothetical protein NC318_10795 [Blautia sp.]|nr:hypothetical protein [Lachnoclostridium sp.]MCM1212081.1 hypothetical protein [Blautia sp.]